jgi:hypothetical protein
MIITRRHSPELVQPGERALDHEAPAVSSRAFVPGKTLSLIPQILAGNAGDRPASFEAFPKRPDGVGPVAQKLSKPLAGAAPAARNADPIQNRKRQFDFVDRPSFQETRQRRPVPVHHKLPFGRQSASAPAHTAAPFFAGAKLPSRMPCDNFNRPRFPSWPSKTRSTRAHTPFLCQAKSRRWQEVLEPYSGGMSFHRHPVFNTKRIPSSVRRSSARGRPCLWRGSSNRIRLHSLSDSSVSRFFCFKERLHSLGGMDTVYSLLIGLVEAFGTNSSSQRPLIAS